MILTKPLKLKKTRYARLRMTDPERDEEYRVLSTSEDVKPTLAGMEEVEKDEDEEFEDLNETGLEAEAELIPEI